MLKTMRFLFAFALGITLFLGACKTTQNTSASAKSIKEEAPANTLLWKVEGNGLTNPSYVFGTIHMIGQSDYFMSEATQKAVESSEQIVLELDMDDPNLQMQMMQHIMMKDGMTLDQLVTAEEYKKIDEAIKKAMGMSVEMFKTMNPMMVSSMFAIKFIEGTPASYEQKLIAMAKAQNKEVKGIETIAEQMGAIKNIPEKEHAKMLVELIDDLDKGKEQFAQLVSLYKSQNIEGLHDMIVDQSGGDDFAQHLLYSRNQNWISRIGEMAKEKTSFIAVGSGHLGGKKGVINLLREAGYKVSPVM